MKFAPDSKFMVYCGNLVDLTKIHLLWLICGFAGRALYDITVIEKIFIQFREA